MTLANLMNLTYYNSNATIFTFIILALVALLILVLFVDLNK